MMRSNISCSRCRNNVTECRYIQLESDSEHAGFLVSIESDLGAFNANLAWVSLFATSSVDLAQLWLSSSALETGLVDETGFATSMLNIDTTASPRLITTNGERRAGKAALKCLEFHVGGTLMSESRESEGRNAQK